MPTKPTTEDPQAAGQPEPPVDHGALLDSVGYNCLQAYLAVVPDIKKQLATLHLRPVEYTVLSLVHGNPGINQKRLGQAIKVSPPNLATLLDRMQSDGLLERQRNPRDKRSQILALTPRGQRLCGQAEHLAAQAEAASTLSPADRRQLNALLQKIFLAP